MVFPRNWLVVSLCLSTAALAGSPKVRLVCKKTLEDGNTADLGPDGAKLEARDLMCTASTRDKKLRGTSATLTTRWGAPGKLVDGRERHGSPNGEGDDFEWYFTLDKGQEWDTCAPELTLSLVLKSPETGATLATVTQRRTQKCEASPAAQGTPERWAEGAKAQVPPDALDLAQRWVDALVDSDPPTLAELGGKGVKHGKKMLKGAALYDPTTYGLKPRAGCDDGKTNCSWGPFSVLSKSPKEFWLYSANDSGYGTFTCAVFSKQGGAWRWSAVTTYDTGEP